MASPAGRDVYKRQAARRAVRHRLFEHLPHHRRRGMLCATQAEPRPRLDVYKRQGYHFAEDDALVVGDGGRVLVIVATPDLPQGGSGDQKPPKRRPWRDVYKRQPSSTLPFASIRSSLSGVMKLLLMPVGVARKVPSSNRTETLPSLAATQPSCHIL